MPVLTQLLGQIGQEGARLRLGFQVCGRLVSLRKSHVVGALLQRLKKMIHPSRGTCQRRQWVGSAVRLQGTFTLGTPVCTFHTDLSGTWSGRVGKCLCIWKEPSLGREVMMRLVHLHVWKHWEASGWKDFCRGTEGEVTRWVQVWPSTAAQREQAGGASGTLYSDSSSKKAPDFRTLSVLITHVSYYSSHYFPSILFS